MRVGIHGPQAHTTYEHTMNCLIQISRYKFSLILAGLTKALQRTNESVMMMNMRFSLLKYVGEILIRLKSSNFLSNSGRMVQSDKMNQNDATMIR